MTKYSDKGSVAIIITVIVAIIFVAVISFYAGLRVANKNMIAENMNYQLPAVNNITDTTNTNSSADTTSMNTQGVAKPVITNEAILAYYNSAEVQSRFNPKIFFATVEPGVISGKSNEKNPGSFELSVKARGDINMDGYEDVMLYSFSCGASCGNSQVFLLNDKNGGIIELNEGLPGYIGSGAGKSSLGNVQIAGGIITASIMEYVSSGNTSGSLDGGSVKTSETIKKYKYQNGKIVQIN